MGVWEPLFFWLFAVGAVATSVGVLFIKNPLYAALSLIGDFLCFAGLYVLLSAHFLAVTQVLVYTGAIMILFVFIIMLLNLNEQELGERQFRLHHILAYLTAGIVFALAVSAIAPLVDQQQVATERQRVQQQAQNADGDEASEGFRVESPVPGLYAAVNEPAINRDFRAQIQSWEDGTATPADEKYRTYDPDRSFEVPPVLRASEAQAQGGTSSMFGTVEPISILLVNRFVVPFELIAVLLLAAIFGAVVIAKKRL